MIKKLKPILYFLIFIFGLTIDRLTKFWAINSLCHRDIRIFSNLNLTLAWNRGVSWGFFSFKSFWGFLFLALVIFLVLIMFIFHVRYQFKRQKNIFFELLILVGAISNLIDRILYRAVADFIDVHIGIWHWPVFNFADILVVIGVLGIFARYIKYVYFTKDKRIKF